MLQQLTLLFANGSEITVLQICKIYSLAPVQAMYPNPKLLYIQKVISFSKMDLLSKVNSYLIKLSAALSVLHSKDANLFRHRFPPKENRNFSYRNGSSPHRIAKLNKIYSEE